jgi:hypothetical protein
MTMRRSTSALPLLAALALLVPAAPAAAVDCDQTFTDSRGLEWDTDYTAGLYSPSAQGYEYMDPMFARDYGSEYEANGDLDENCVLEDGGRELRYPAVMIGDLEVSPTIYVPSGDPAFTRHLLILRNPNAEPAALQPVFNGYTEYSGDTRVRSSSSGDQTGTPADDWMVLYNSADGTDPHLGLLWNFGSGDRRRSASEIYDYDDRFTTPFPPFDDGDNDPQFGFGRIVVPPGGAAAVMIAGVHRDSAGDAEAAARELQAAPESLLSGISDDEKRILLNVGLPDRDVDGLANGSDNCPDAVNPDQGNLDGDAQGDACDADADGDGLDAATEAARGTDPRRADTDGDGKVDGIDACPLTAGLGADGCPRFDTPPPAPDTAGPGVTIRRLGARMRLRAFRRGVPCVVDLTEAAAVTCRLIARARRVARVAAAGDLELASRALPLAAGRRSARLRPRRGLIRQRRFRATLQVVATDAAGNRTTRTKRFRVRP